MQTHHHHPTGNSLKQQIADYAAELKHVGILKPSTDPSKYADRVFADVFA
jgi:NitT/TauT family transport system substrate-binding protein